MATSRLWKFMSDKDRKKLAKVGFATPRGGGKNAYQNHVSRSNRVIVPFERLFDVDLDLFVDGYVVRLLPEQCFSAPGQLNPRLESVGIVPGANAFVLYRTRSTYDHDLPPLDGWSVRGLAGGELARKRGVPDTGEYVVRLSDPTETEGLPQGIFAPEYATATDNFLCQATLAWLIGCTRDHPYDQDDFGALEAFLDEVGPGLTNTARLARAGILVDGETRCPLCLRPLRWDELHKMLDLTEATGLANAGIQIVGSTRSTAINLFHMQPLLYAKELHHKPHLVAWGHAVCNTLLGQRACIPLHKMQTEGFALLREGGAPWGYSAEDELMLRSEDRGVWARLIARALPDIPLTETLGPDAVISEEDGLNEEDGFD